MSSIQILNDFEDMLEQIQFLRIALEEWDLQEDKILTYVQTWYANVRMAIINIGYISETLLNSELDSGIKLTDVLEASGNIDEFFQHCIIVARDYEIYRRVILGIDIKMREIDSFIEEILTIAIEIIEWQENIELFISD